jgi:hypothetical protein
MLDVHKYVRKPQYLMAPELPLVLVSCGFQGVLFKSHPDIKIKRGGVLRNHNKNDTMLSNSGH